MNDGKLGNRSASSHLLDCLSLLHNKRLTLRANFGRACHVYDWEMPRGRHRHGIGSRRSSTFADKRVALVVGNSAYKNVTRLNNPKNDATLMAETLRSPEFSNCGRMKSSLR